MRNIRWLTSDFDYIGLPSETRDGEYHLSEILNRPQNEVSFGSVVDSQAREFSSVHRQIYESTEWVTHLGVILKKKDATEQALDGDYGHDWTEGDLPEVLERLQNSPAAIEWLLQSGLRSEYEINQEDALNHADFGVIDGTSSSESDEDSGEIQQEFDFSGVNVQDFNFGYTAPRDRYQVVDRKYVNRYKMAAERREKNFENTMKSLYQVTTQNDKIPSNNYVRCLENFMDKIRESYREDKNLCMEWNEEQKETYRDLYSQMMRNKGLDEETIRRNLYYGFDRVRHETWDIYTNGKFYKTYYNRPSQEKLDQYGSMALRGKYTKPSFWEKCKSNAFVYLSMTMGQWRKVYNHLFEELVSSIKLMAINANTSESRYQVRCLVNKYQAKLGGRDEATKVLQSMPRNIKK